MSKQIVQLINVAQADGRRQVTGYTNDKFKEGDQFGTDLTSSLYEVIEVVESKPSRLSKYKYHYSLIAKSI